MCWIVVTSPSLGNFVSKERLISTLPNDIRFERGFKTREEAEKRLVILNNKKTANLILISKRSEKNESRNF
jgi:hypothetical protein